MASAIPGTPVVSEESEHKPNPHEFDRKALPELGKDELVVGWDGPDDPANPRNWTIRRKWTSVAFSEAFTFISPLVSSISAPTSVKTAVDLHITNGTILSMTTSIFVLAFAIGPLVIGPLSEHFGRRPLLLYCNAFFLAFNIATGFAQSTGQLLAFRFLAGLGGGAPLAIGGGVLSDCFAPEQRGRAVSIFSLAPVLGPTIGPLVGSWIADKTTWRWSYWATSIFDGLIFIGMLLFIEETYPIVLLEKKAKTIIKAWDPEKALPTKIRTTYPEDRSVHALVTKSILRPVLFFWHEPIIQLLGTYMAFVYATSYLIIITVPALFAKTYHQSIGIIGLHYLSLGMGSLISGQLSAVAMNKILEHYKAKNNGKLKPEYRIPILIPGTIAMPLGLLLIGWGAEKHVHWIICDFGLILIGCSIVTMMIGVQSYIIDAYNVYSASGLAAVSAFRSLVGFGFPLFAPAMFDTLGYGKGCTLLAALAIGIGLPAPWIFWFFGERIRKRSRYAPDNMG
ncbi:MFS polyamine transporter [Auriscalpium vulgare]|uniref:MFS polyamine transporter n=1 Tax=Auriscalpium vulgare TaxID=40419 RepID=A0ACB8SBU3_9AGAM|nr:MFS polyamine transporter [Auriscalpium vulgare]